MRYILLAAVLSCGATGAASAAEVCGNGSLGASQERPAAGARILSERCKPGDVLMLSVSAAGVAAMACDMTKAFVVAGQYIICVLGPIRAGK